jgi:hypothetical protein
MDTSVSNVYRNDSDESSNEELNGADTDGSVVFVVRDRSVMLSDMHFIACSICSMNCCSFATVDSSLVISADMSVRILSKTVCLFVECFNERDTFNGFSTSRTHWTWAAINEQQPIDISRAYETRSWYFSLFIENMFDSLLLFMFIRTCRHCRTPNRYVFASFRFVSYVTRCIRRTQELFRLFQCCSWKGLLIS